ncbi:putative restriction endonuclease [Fodinibius salinus]|uniref:Putative restriction endonuclease n=1 Tax=Fodinibius salinus TaxID=860790 RepID=A0A5D3YK55_9BACT|nr:HNH endonuclease [Fodinibius salinus]TYP93346.1 putative restriction endonuclease [Fodinibius salinus]
MTEQEILQKFQSLTVWKSGDRRAPHKPLLVLLAIGYLQNNDKRLLGYKEIDPELKELLTEFGTPRNAGNTHYPFWRLQNDGMWEVERGDELVLNSSGGVRKTDLREKEIRAGFKPEVYEFLKEHPSVINTICSQLLDAHFPDTIHEDIIHETGISLEEQTISRKKRDPNFRHNVLQAYEYRCAICDFDVRMGAKTLCIEAAHIKWHSHGGPDDITNGIALCTLHHKLFDLGAFTLDEDLQFLISEKVVGTDGFDLWLGRFHGDEIRPPVRAVYEPAVNYIAWNHDEVFKSPGPES